MAWRFCNAMQQWPHHHCHATLVKPPLPHHCCHVTIATLPLPRHRCHVTVATPPLPHHRCHATVAMPPWPRHRCHATVATSPLPRHRGHATVTVSSPNFFLDRKIISLGCRTKSPSILIHRLRLLIVAIFYPSHCQLNIRVHGCKGWLCTP
jgi:hypothetical protein